MQYKHRRFKCAFCFNAIIMYCVLAVSCVQPLSLLSDVCREFLHQTNVKILHVNILKCFLWFFKQSSFEYLMIYDWWKFIQKQELASQLRSVITRHSCWWQTGRLIIYTVDLISHDFLNLNKSTSNSLADGQSNTPKCLPLINIHWPLTNQILPSVYH